MQQFLKNNDKKNTIGNIENKILKIISRVHCIIIHNLKIFKLFANETWFSEKRY